MFPEQANVVVPVQGDHMNRERLRLLAAHLREVPPYDAMVDDLSPTVVTDGPDDTYDLREELRSFDIGWYHCGTLGCIAGHACLLFGPVLREDDDIGEVAARLLGLNALQQKELFEPRFPGWPWTTAEEAARVLEMIADTGMNPIDAWKQVNTSRSEPPEKLRKRPIRD